MMSKLSAEETALRTYLEPAVEQLKVISIWIAHPSAQSTSTIAQGKLKRDDTQIGEDEKEARAAVKKRHALL